MDCRFHLPTASTASSRLLSPTESARSRLPAARNASITCIPCRASRLPLHTARALDTVLGRGDRSMMRTRTPNRRNVMASDKPLGPAPAMRTSGLR